MDLPALYDALYDTYGDQGWWPGRSDWEILFGSVLIQNTNWRNVDRAIANLTAATGMMPDRLRALAPEKLQELIRPAGFFTRKAATIGHLLDWLGQYDDDLPRIRRVDPATVRQELVTLGGIGNETADDILLYVLGFPTVIIDTYTRRFFKRLGIALPAQYAAAQADIARQWPAWTLRTAQNFHALIIRAEKEKYTPEAWKDVPFSGMPLQWKQS